MTIFSLTGRELFRFESGDPGGGAPPAPGTGEAAPGAPGSTSAGTQNTGGQGPPESIPYARFQEVVHARQALESEYQPFAELIEETGYGADDLRRLALWESEYTQDPVGTWLRHAQELDSLPDEVKAAVVSALGDGTQGAPPAGGTPPPQGSQSRADDDPPEWAKPLIQRHEADEAARMDQEVSAFYNDLEKAWRDLDVQQGLVFPEGHAEAGKSSTPPAVIHAFIAAHSPQAENVTALIRTAREAWLSTREDVLGAEIRRPGGTVPRSVPGGGGAGAAAPPVRPRTLTEATQQAKAAAEAGLLVRNQ